MKHFIGSIIALLSLVTLQGQERFLKRAEEDLKKENWTSAESNIRAYESKAGARPESYFMRHWLLRKTASGVEQFDESRQQLELAINGFASLPGKTQKEWCDDIGFCGDRLPALMIEADSLLFESVKRAGQLKEVNWFLDKYPASPNKSKAIQWKIHLIFLAAKSKNTEESYIEFLAAHPDHEDAPSAITLLWEAAWKNATGKNTIAAYESFIKKYPKAIQVEQARIKMAEIAWALVRDGSEQELLLFAKQYAYAVQAIEAWAKAERLGWERVTRSESFQAYLDFVKSYPNSTQKEVAMKRAEWLAWTDAKRSAGNAKLKQFMLDFPESDSIATAKTLIEERTVDVLPWIISNRKYKLYNLDRNEFVNEAEYDCISPASPSRFVVCLQEKQGIIDKWGNTILPCNYENINQIGPGLFRVGLNKKLGVIDKDAELMIPFQYDLIAPTNKGDYVVGKTTNSKTLYGLLDAQGQELIPLKYGTFQQLNDSCFVAGNGQSMGVVNKKGITLLSARFELIEKGGDERQWLIREKGKWGVIRSNNSYLIKPQFEYISVISDAQTKKDGNPPIFYLGTQPNSRALLMDTAGTILLSHTGQISHLGKDLFRIEPVNTSSVETESIQIFSANRRVFLGNRRFKQVEPLGENKMWVSESGRSGYIDTNGRAVTPFIFADDGYISNPNLGEVGDTEEGDNEEGAGCDVVIDEESNEEVDEINATSCVLYDVEWLEEGVNKSNPWSNSSGVFSEGFAAVNVNEKIGYIDASGTLRIQAQYVQATPFYKGMAQVVKKIENRAGEEVWRHQLIDTSGKVLADEAYIQGLTPDGEGVIIRKEGESDDLRFELLDLSTRKTRPIASGFNYVSAYPGYFKGYYKDVNVFISDNGKPLIDRNVDFSHYNAEILASEGVSLIYEDKVEEGISKLKQALTIRPKYIRAMMALVDAYKKKEYHSEVMYWYNRAVNTSPEDFSIRESRKDYLFEKKYWSDALPDLEMLTQKEPGAFLYWFQKGHAELQLGYYDQAIQSHTRALSIQKNDAITLYNRAFSYEKKGYLTLSLNDYTSAIKYCRNDDNVSLGGLHNNRGLLFLRMNKKLEACQDFRKGSSYGNESAATNLYYKCRN